MDFSVLLIHGECARDCRHRMFFEGVDPAIGFFVARTFDELRRQPLAKLVLLDLDLAHPPALEVLRWLRAEKTWGPVPVIALASKTSADRVSPAYELGASGCVMKSDNGGVMEEVVRGISSYARVLGAPEPDSVAARRGARAGAAAS